MKKKLTASFAVILAALMTLTACGETASTNNDSTSAPENNANNTSPTAEDNSNDNNNASTGERVKVTYGGWLNKFDAVILEEVFEKAHPEIDLEILDTWMNNEELTRLAATGELPDVINIDRLPLALQNQWLMDITDLYNADPDKDMAYENLVNYGTVDGKLYAHTNAIYFYGMNVNLTLLEQLNIPRPDYNWTVDECVDILKKATVKGDSLGTLSLYWILGTMQGLVGRDEITWGGYNTETKRFELGDEWLEAVNLYQDLYEGGNSLWEQTDLVGRPWEFEAGSPEAVEAEQARTDYIMETLGTIEDGWAAGKTSMQAFETWLIGWDEVNPRGGEHQYAGFEFDSYPFPSEDGSSRVAMYTDFMSITSSCKNPEAAYEFLKFCTYSEQGYLDRVDYAINYNKDEFAAAHPDVPEDQLVLKDYILMKWAPACNTEAAKNAFKKLHGEVYDNGRPGIFYFLDNISTGFADPIRFMPGYEEAWNLNQSTIMDEVINGSKSPADIQKDLENRMNQIVEDSCAAIGIQFK